MGVLSIEFLLLFQAANAAFTGVKELCAMYNEGRALVNEVSKTVGEVKKITKEVKGIWGWISKLFAEPEKKELEDIRPVKEVKTKATFDEKAIYAEIGDKLVSFFKNYKACADAIRTEEERIEKIYDPDGETYERSIRLVIAKTQLEQMGQELTDYMIYHVPNDLKDLYTRVNDMIGTVKVKQELARKTELRRKAQREAEAREAADRAWLMGACTVVVIFVAIYLAGLMWAINRVSHGGM